MIVTDYNKMSLNDLETINRTVGTSYIINDGKIVGTKEIIPTQPASK